MSWSRIIPEEGKINQKGIDFYNNLINELLKNNIEPLITIYHWDLPVWVFEKGGWESDKIIGLFEEYARICAVNFSDRVKYWFVFNEPQCFLTGAYFKGVGAPFYSHRDKMREITLIAMKAHKKAVEALRKYGKQDLKIGIALSNSISVPKSDNINDISFAKNKTFSTPDGILDNCWYSDPLVGKMPVKINDCEFISSHDLDEIFSPLDFVGLNYYLPKVDNEYIPLSDHKTSVDWYVDERGIYWLLKYYFERYKLPILISETGFAEIDSFCYGKIHDILRGEEIVRYCDMALKAKNEGVDLLGILYWSAIDNFEWIAGYRPRFGLIYVDYLTQKRYLKDSAFVYRDYIKKHKNI